MVDTGCAHTHKELLKALEGRPVERIVNTHTHEDHIGANGALQWQNPRLDILAHPLALPVLADGKIVDKKVNSRTLPLSVKTGAYSN